MKLIHRELIFPLENAPTPSCHASTVCALPDGTLLAAWFGGQPGSVGNGEIWLSRKESGGDNWGTPVQMSQTTDLACWNPVLYADGENVTLFFKRSKKIASWQTFVRRSSDGGKTWSAEEELVPGDVSGGRGPVKNKPIRLRGTSLIADGVLLAGASHESADASRWDAFFDRSTDGGLTRRRTEYLFTEPYAKLIQPTMWQDSDGVHAYPTDLPNNNSGVDLTRLPDGTLALVCNPVGENWGARSPLSLFLSADGGKSWEKELDLATGEGEFSYPAVIWKDSPDGGRLQITFTWGRRGVMWCELG